MTVARRQRDVYRMRFQSLLLAALLTTSLAGCMDHADADAPPEPASELTAEPLSGGAHLTWVDNSDNEDHFMVMRMEDGVDADYTLVVTVPFDSLTHHDGNITAGATYTYKIVAMNSAGESESDEVTFVAP